MGNREGPEVSGAAAPGGPRTEAPGMGALGMGYWGRRDRERLGMGVPEIRHWEGPGMEAPGVAADSGTGAGGNRGWGTGSG